MRKQILRVALVVCMVLALLPTVAVPAKAADYSATYTGTMNSKLTLVSGTYLLDGCTINSSQQAIFIYGSVTLVIKGNVSLSAGDTYAGIEVLSGRSVTIIGYEGTTNKLTVRGGDAKDGEAGKNGQSGSSSGGGYGGAGGNGGDGGGAAIGSNGGTAGHEIYNNFCTQGAEIGTVNIDSTNLTLDLKGGAGGYGDTGGSGGYSSDPGKSGGGGGGGGGGGFPGPAIGRGGSNGLDGGDGGSGVSVSGTYGSVGGGGGGSGGYGYYYGGGGNGGAGACYAVSGIYKYYSGYYANTVSAGNTGMPYTNNESSLQAYRDDGCFAYPGQGGSVTLSSGVISGGAGGLAASSNGKSGYSGQSRHVSIVTPVSYKSICFNANGGSENSYAMSTGSTVGSLPSSNPTRTGYTFKGWNTQADGKGSTVAATTTLYSTVNTYYAMWEQNNYDATITVNKNGSVWTSVGSTSVVLSTSQTSAETGKVTATPSNGVFTFSGVNPTGTTYVWAKNKAGSYVKQGSVSVSSTTLTVNYYDVTLSVGTGIDSVSGGGTYLSGETATISAVLKQGYTWSKWSDNNTTMSGRTITVSAKTDLSAIAVATPATSPTITGTTGATLVYGYTSGSISVSATAAAGHTIGYQWYSNKNNSTSGGTLISGTTSANYDIPSALSVGSYYFYCIVTATRTDNAQTESATSGVAEVTVGAASMSITANGYEDIYDGNSYGISVTIPLGATLKFGTTSGTYNLDSTPTYANVGEYKVYYQVTKANYTTVTGYATVKITSATPTVALENGKSDTYDGRATVYSGAVTLTGVNGESGSAYITGNVNYRYIKKGGETSAPSDGYTSGMPEGAGTYWLQAMTAAGGNYTASAWSTAVTFTVSKAAASVTINEPGTITYDGSAVTCGTGSTDITYIYTAEADGTVSVKWYADNNGTKGAELSSAPMNAGTYWVGVSATAGDNYTAVNEVTKKFTISPKYTDVIWSSVSYTYTGEVQAVIAKYKDVNNNDVALSVSFAGTSGAANGDTTFKEAGNYTATAAMTTADGNYVLTNTTKTLTIAPLTASLSWSGYSNLIYNGSAKSVTAAVNNLITGDSCTVTVSGGDKTNAGTYTATAIGLSNANYTLPSVVTREYTITKVKVTVPAAVKNLVFNGTEQTGVAAGDKYSLTGNKAINAGDYNATASLTDKMNYEWDLASPTSNDQSIAWRIEPIYAITAATTANGSYTVKIDGSVVTSSKSGDTITITPTANAGYELDTITVTKTGDSTAVTVINKSFTMPAYPVTVSVTFKVSKYAITKANTINGSFSVAETADYNSTVTVTPTANVGYELDTITVNKTGDTSTTVTVSDKSFTMPAYPVTVSVKFKVSKFAITKVNTVNGSFSVAETADYNSTVSITPTANVGYELDTITVTKTGDASTTVTVSNKSFTMPAYPVTVNVTFKVSKFAITKANTVNGSFSVAGTADYNSTVTITPTANVGYELDAITVTKTGDTNTVVTVSNNSFTMPAYPVTVTVTFRVSKYAITKANTTNGSFSVAETADYNSTVTVTLTANVGYELGTITVTKTGDTSTTVTVSNKSFTMPAYPVTITVTFKVSKFAITKANTINGNFSVPETADYNSTVTVTPTAYVGFMVNKISVCKTGDTNTTLTVSNNTFIMPAYAVTVSVTFKPIPKTEVTINATTSVSNLIYNGSTQNGYTGSVTVTGNLVPVSELIFTYQGTGSTTYAVSTAAPKNAGTYKLTISVAQTNKNYSGSKMIEFTIAKEKLTKPTLSGAYTYSGSEQTAILNGFDSIVMNVSGNKKTNAGATDIIISIKDKTNYEWTAGSTADVIISWIIGKAKLTVTANDNTITYGAAPANSGVTYTGFVGGETKTALAGTLTYAYSYTQYGNVGSSYTITPKGLTSDNYEITFKTGKLTVTVKEVAIIIDNLNSIEGEALKEPTYQITSGEFYNDDAKSVTLTKADGKDANTYAITGACSNANYKVTFKEGVYTVLQRIVDDDKNNTGVEIIAGNGLDPDIKLVVVVVSNADYMNVDLKDAVGSNCEIGRVFEVTLELNGVRVQPNGKIEIRLPVPDDIKDNKNLSVVYIDTDGKATNVDAKRDGDFMVFEADHLSTYAIVVTGSLAKVLTITVISFVVLLGGGFCFFWFVVGKRRKKEKE